MRDSTLSWGYWMPGTSFPCKNGEAVTVLSLGPWELPQRSPLAREAKQGRYRGGLLCFHLHPAGRPTDGVRLHSLVLGDQGRRPRAAW